LAATKYAELLAIAGEEMLRLRDLGSLLMNITQTTGEHETGRGESGVARMAPRGVDVLDVLDPA
jgi:hypothetical protein